MLDANALSQLSQLKSDIQASKDYAEGTVAATNGRFGFVKTDDGRDAYLSADKMERLLDGDRVKINLVSKDDGRYDAELESLISSSITKFVGQYRVRGKGHFVVPLGARFNRWVFVPPKQRKDSREGDFVVAKIVRHPYADGKAQAKVVFRIGSPSDALIEHKFVKAKYELNYRTDEAQKTQTQDLVEASEKTNIHTFDGRRDLSDKLFFTIDSASTLDMDDALSVEKTDAGYELLVAIADPGHFIAPSSPLAQQAASSAQTVYLLGGAVPMFPSTLAHSVFSLEQEKQKPALVCRMHIDVSGAVGSYTFERAVITSRHKLSYDQVSAHLEDANPSFPSELQQALALLSTLSDSRRNYREKHYLVTEDQSDYSYQLDDMGHIRSIQERSRNIAQQIVEEAMLATNICAGEFLKAQKLGLFSTHRGFREDRMGEVKALLKEEGIDANSIDTLQGHIDLFNKLAQDDQLCALAAPLRRMMQPSQISSDAEPHFGLGLPQYATITSPIRRYVDLFNHWCIHSALDKEAATTLVTPKPEEIEQLNEAIAQGRQADRELIQWLLCIYTQQLIDDPTPDDTDASTHMGTVRIVTQQGFGVRLHKTGIEGFVLFDKKQDKTFDAKRMTLEVNDQLYRIGDEVEVEIVSVDLDKRRIAFSVGDK